MFKLILFAFILHGFFSACFAQSSATVSLSVNSSNHVYKGTYNPVRITVEGIPFAELRFTAQNASLKRNDSLIRIFPVGDRSIKLSVYHRSKLVRVLGFSVLPMPAPQVTLSGLRSGPIRQSILIASKKLQMRYLFDARDLNEDEIVPNCTVISFDMIAKSLDGTSVSYHSNSNKLTTAQKRLLSLVRRGQRVYFENIKARSANGSIFYADKLNFKVL